MATKRHDPAAGPGELDADLVTEPLDHDPFAEPAGALTDELDLHNFLPRECADAVDEYLDAARAAGFASVRIVHGKGTGALRQAVHAVLARHPAVRAYQLAADRGGWGATTVELHPP